MAQVTRAAHAAEVASKLADNTSGGISPQDIREAITDLEDSVTWFNEADVSADTTPQLGGDLDVNGNSIVSASNGNITIAPNGTGDVIIGNFTIDADATVGASQDNFVLTYDHSAGKWGAEASTFDPQADAGGWAYPVHALGNLSGAVTLDHTAGNFQALTNVGAITLAPPAPVAPAAAVVMNIVVTNSATAGAIDTTAFDIVEGDGDLTTVDGDVFTFDIMVNSGVSLLTIRKAP